MSAFETLKDAAVERSYNNIKMNLAEKGGDNRASVRVQLTEEGAQPQYGIECEFGCY
jgi:hypothetical protein